MSSSVRALAFCAALFSLPSAVPAQACQPRSVKLATFLNNADTVAVVKVTQTHHLAYNGKAYILDDRRAFYGTSEAMGKNPGLDLFLAERTEALKGDPGAQMALWREDDGAPTSMRPGRSYLVFGHRQGPSESMAPPSRIGGKPLPVVWVWPCDGPLRLPESDRSVDEVRELLRLRGERKPAVVRMQLYLRRAKEFPAPDAKVQLCLKDKAGHSLCDETNAKGLFSLEVPAGDYTLTVPGRDKEHFRNATVPLDMIKFHLDWAGSYEDVIDEVTY